MRLVKKQASFVRACFKKNDSYSIGTQVLDYIEEHSTEDPTNPGHKAGLFKAVTRGVTDTKGVEAQMAKEINGFFAPKKRFENEVHFDKCFTNADIKQFLEVHLGATNWEVVPKTSARHAT